MRTRKSPRGGTTLLLAVALGVGGAYLASRVVATRRGGTRSNGGRGGTLVTPPEGCARQDATPVLPADAAGVSPSEFAAGWEASWLLAARFPLPEPHEVPPFIGFGSPSYRLGWLSAIDHAAELAACPALSAQLTRANGFVMGYDYAAQNRPASRGAVLAAYGVTDAAQTPAYNAGVLDGATHVMHWLATTPEGTAVPAWSGGVWQDLVPAYPYLASLAA